jgi:hypothetical protein
MMTFLKNIDGATDTVMVFEDESGYKFGGVCYEEWSVSKDFFGNGENFVYTFKDGDDILAFKSTNENTMY